MLISPLRNRNTLHAHTKPRSIHHDEHRLQAAIFLAHQIANGPRTHLALVVTKQEHCGRTAMQAKLVLN